MTNPITFFVQGEPKAQPRARAFAKKMGNRYVARVFDDSSAEGWKSFIALAARRFIPPSPYLGPICVNAYFHFPRPLSHYGKGKKAAVLKKNAPLWHTCKPDRDNLDKALLDTLKKLGMFKDDSQVCDGTIRKVYTCGQVGLSVEILLLENQQLKHTH